MSGGRQSYPGGPATAGSGGAEGTPCDQLHFEAQLHSLSPAAQRVAVGQTLDVRLDEERLRVVVADEDGNVVGAIAAFAAELLECLRTGHAFVAEVVRADDGDVRATVRAA